MKCLVNIPASGFITFSSSFYGGQVTDKFITNDSRLYEIIGSDYCGFQIQEDLVSIFVIYKYLQVHGEDDKRRETKNKRNYKFMN